MSAYAILLSGGVGSRFWPLSREAFPKQFLNVCTERPMIEELLRQISPLVKKENIFIAANALHSQKMKACLKQYAIPEKNFFFEPEGKNTFGPIAFLTKRIHAKDRDAIIMVLPADHYVRRIPAFLQALKRARGVASDGYLVTLGIRPQRPETGYGYIKAGRQRLAHNAFKVDRFIEKPDLERAKMFVKDKNYFWNGGIFVFKASVMLEEIRRLAPAVFTLIVNMKNTGATRTIWGCLPSISIDYAIMEKTGRGAVVPAEYGWIELGSWQALDEVLPHGKGGNIFKGRVIDIGSKNTLVRSGGRLVATLGLTDLVVIDTKDALLVCAKDRVQEIKKIVAILKQKGFKDQL